MTAHQLLLLLSVATVPSLTVAVHLLIPEEAVGMTIASCLMI
jgi:hypothetical protein